MYELPTEIIIEGRPYSIRNKGDYRMVMDVFSVLEDTELDRKERIISALIIFYSDFNDMDDVLREDANLEQLTKEMYEFFDGDRLTSEKKDHRKLIDWDKDSAMICSAINHVAGKEIRSEPYIHWWTFLSYYMSVGESVFSTVVGIRDKLMNGKTLDKWERQYKNENPQYFKWSYKTADDIDAEEWLKSVWNKE